MEMIFTIHVKMFVLCVFILFLFCIVVIASIIRNYAQNSINKLANVIFIAIEISHKNYKQVATTHTYNIQFVICLFFCLVSFFCCCYCWSMFLFFFFLFFFETKKISTSLNQNGMNNVSGIQIKILNLSFFSTQFILWKLRRVKQISNRNLFRLAVD